MAATSIFQQRLAAGVKSKNTLLCVGLDPHATDPPLDATEDEIVAFCRCIIVQTSFVAVAYKLDSWQSASA